MEDIFIEMFVVKLIRKCLQMLIINSNVFGSFHDPVACLSDQGALVDHIKEINPSIIVIVYMRKDD